MHYEKSLYKRGEGRRGGGGATAVNRDSGGRGRTGVMRKERNKKLCFERYDHVEQDILLVYFADVACKPSKPDWLLVWSITWPCILAPKKGQFQ